MQDNKWYVVHARTLYEDKVRAHIEHEIEKRNLQEKILQIVVPTEDVVEIRKNKKHIMKVLRSLRNVYNHY
jgi:transcriptional antiterminator NusG